MLGFAIFMGAVLVIVVAALCGTECKRIAEMKGHDGQRYFWWGFLIPAAGMIFVAALPDRAIKEETPAASVQNNELPEL